MAMKVLKLIKALRKLKNQFEQSTEVAAVEHVQALIILFAFHEDISAT